MNNAVEAVENVEVTEQQKTECDSQIWEFLIDCLYEGSTRVLFEKSDGTMREMICTLNDDLIDYEFAGAKVYDANALPPKERTMVTVWDTENEGWRKLTKGKIDTVDALGEHDDE